MALNAKSLKSKPSGSRAIEPSCLVASNAEQPCEPQPRLDHPIGEKDNVIHVIRKDDRCIRALTELPRPVGGRLHS